MDSASNTISPTALRRTRAFWVILAVVAAVVGLFGYNAWTFAHPPVGQYAAVVADVAAGRLDADPIGRVVMPKRFAGVTPRDEAFLTRRPDGSFALVLPTAYGRGKAMDGLLYTSRPLTPADTYHQPSPGGVTHRYINVGDYPLLTIQHRVDDHWYRVAYEKR